MSVFAVIILGLSGLAGVMILGFALILGKLSADCDDRTIPDIQEPREM